MAVVKFLLEKGADIETRDDVSHVIIRFESIKTSNLTYICYEMHQLGYTPLIFATLNGYLAAVEHLVQRGANIETKDEDVSHVMFIRHTCILIRECIRREGLRSYVLLGMAIYEWLNIWWREELTSRQRIM